VPVAGESEPVPARLNIARYCLADNARVRPDQVAITVVGDGLAATSMSFGEVDLSVRRRVAGLLSLGLPAGSRVMIRMANDIDYALTWFAAMGAGLIALPSSSQLTASEAEFLLDNSGAAAVALSADLVGGFVAPAGVVVLDPARLAELATFEPVDDYADTAADDPAYLIYTSGTSGRPKGVLHAHRAAFGRRPMHEHWMALRATDRVLHAGAFNWTYTLGVGLVDPWSRGASSILYNGSRDVQVWPRLIERYRATIFATVPTLYRQILKYCNLAEHDLASLRHGLTAGEPMPTDLLAAWGDATGTELYEALGMSEISTYVSSSPSDPIRVGSPGRPQAGRRVVILPREGGTEPLPAGEVGLLAVHRSDPSLMLGYWNRPDEEELVYRGEWFVGGDLAFLDADGYVWFEGRNDDLMNAMGYRVSPLEVESVLAEHPMVAEVAVTEVRVRADVSVIAAFVVPRDAAEPDAAALLDFARERLAAYKCPKEIVFVDSLPRTRNGKVTRRALTLLGAQSSGSESSGRHAGRPTDMPAS